MSKSGKIAIYLGLTALSVLFGYLFVTHYLDSTNRKEAVSDGDLANIRLPEESKGQAGTIRKANNLALYGASFAISVLFLGFMIAHDVSVLVANRAVKTLFNEEGTAIADPLYDQAEQEWANGNHLEAVRLMREYLSTNPKEQHVALRIAEIYEKDLKNPLAAALEYEEVLTKKLSPERWGWAAIHLCNLYSKLNQTEKAIELLRRIDSEYGDTAAGEKARQRLAMIEGGDGSGAISEDESSAR